ncbi:hypothetical protein LIER_13134 [Lithospermum erythrorhizon]|uniref:MULE transposase domain-containing protein n=1 Tax=Lithospermum erythrorhizon TaxID=34254 RepID=A0AAV3PV76_LITER
MGLKLEQHVSREAFKSGCNRIVGVDGCHLKTKRGCHLLVVVGIDPNNNIFPIAYGLVEVENKSSWEWFLNHLYEDIRYGVSDENEQNKWTFMSDKQKCLIEAFKNILLGVDHRFCVRHLHENFKRASFRGQTFKELLWNATTATTTQYFNDAMSKMKKLDVQAFDWFGDKEPKQWSRAYFTTAARCDVLLNNICEVFNAFILDARDKSVLTLMSIVKDLIMMRMEMNREKAEKWEGRLCPKPRKRLLLNIKAASSCMPMKCDKSHFQVYSGSTANHCVVDLGKRQRTCRKWQLNGIP